MSYTHLWLDTIAGLKTQGWVVKGGNFTSFLMLEKEGKTIKVFLQNSDKLNKDDINHVIVRYS